MEKKGIVTLAKFNREWTGNYGVMYDHDIVFENGDKGTYSSKSMQQDKFVLGQEADYTIDDSNPQFPSKIKPISTFQPGNNSRDNENPKRQESIQRQTALKIASECVDINKHGIDSLFAVADKFAAWLDNKPDAVVQTPQQPTEIDTTKAVDADKLPL